MHDPDAHHYLIRFATRQRYFLTSRIIFTLHRFLRSEKKMTPRVQFCLTSLILLLITAHRIAGLAPHSSWTKLMIVSGGSGQEASVEVIDLSGAKDCPSRELKMPTPVGPGAVGTFFNGSAWVCGGEIDMVTSSNICFRFDDKVFINTSSINHNDPRNRLIFSWKHGLKGISRYSKDDSEPPLSFSMKMNG